MKKSELHKIVREAIQETINEETFAGIAALDNLKKNKKFGTLAPDAKIAAEDELKKKGVVTLEGNEIDEMANVAVRYELAPGTNAADFSGKKNRIITAMQATGEPMSKIDVAGELGYDKQNPINADFMALVASGAITQSGGQAAPRLNRPQPAAPEVGDEDGEDAPAGYEGPEGGIEGDMSDEEVEASFAKMMGSEEEEPEAGEVEAGEVSGASMSDEEFNAWMSYQELERRLANVKSNILKARKSRPTPGDIQDTPSNEVENLRDLKKRLENKMADIASQFPSVAKNNKAPEIETPETEPLDEWMKERMQYYAGIKK
jgi:hypothetical protein